ncbi:MAG: SiaB family protein kinase [Salinivirgaceae bacterium]
MSFNLDSWISANEQEDVIFAFKGELSESMLTELLLIIEEKIDQIPGNRKLKKKLYNVAIESMQNLFHHSDEVYLNGTQKKHSRYMIMFITQNDGAYKIRTGNFLTEKKVQFLNKHIEKINNLSRDELKLEYKEILNNQTFSNKGGGGLGLIDIARKAESKIDYNFYSDKNSLSFFDFCIEIKQ